MYDKGWYIQIKSANSYHRLKVNGNTWFVCIRLEYSVKTRHYVTTDSNQILWTDCPYFNPWQSRKVAPEQWLAVSTMCRTAFPSRSLRSIDSFLALLTIASERIETFKCTGDRTNSRHDKYLCVIFPSTVFVLEFVFHGLKSFQGLKKIIKVWMWKMWMRCMKLWENVCS